MFFLLLKVHNEKKNLKKLRLQKKHQIVRKQQIKKQVKKLLKKLQRKLKNKISHEDVFFLLF